MSKTPIFISGIGRSGTSAVIKSIAEHAAVVKPDNIGEAPFISHFINFLMKFEDESPEKVYNLVNYKLDEEGRAAEFSRLLSMIQYGININEPHVTGDHWVAKASFPQPAFDKATDVFRDLRAIYVMRNGIEVVNSAKSFHGFAHLSFAQLCSRWADNLSQCRYMFDRDNCSIIKHHELVQDPHSVFTRVFDELQLPQDDAPANFIQTNLFNSSFDKTSQLQSTANVFEERLKCWYEWSEEEQTTFIAICGDLMEKFEFTCPYQNKMKAYSNDITDTAKVIPLSTGKNSQREESIESEALLKKLADFYSKVPNSMPVKELNYFANPSTKNNFLFMENPKVASTSLLKSLHSLELEPGTELQGGPHDRNLSPIPKLSKLDKIQRARMLFSPEIYKYTIVRNPYTRLLSAYLSKIEKPLRAKAEILAIIKGVSKEDITDLSTNVSFEEFVDVVVSQNPIDMNPHWRRQMDQTLIELINYDYVACFENLNDDFLSVCSKVYGVSNTRLSQSKNKTGSNTRYSEYYTDALADKVFAKFQCDFDYFNYSPHINDGLSAPDNANEKISNAV